MTARANWRSSSAVIIGRPLAASSRRCAESDSATSWRRSRSSCWSMAGLPRRADGRGPSAWSGRGCDRRGRSSERTSTERRMLRPDSVRSASAAFGSSAMMPSPRTGRPAEASSCSASARPRALGGRRDQGDAGRGRVDRAEMQRALQAAEPLAQVGDVLELAPADQHDGVGLVDDRHRGRPRGQAAAVGEHVVLAGSAQRRGDVLPRGPEPEHLTRAWSTPDQGAHAAGGGLEVVLEVGGLARAHGGAQGEQAGRRVERVAVRRCGSAGRCRRPQGRGRPPPRGRGHRWASPATVTLTPGDPLAEAKAIRAISSCPRSRSWMSASSIADAAPDQGRCRARRCRSRRRPRRPRSAAR